MTHMTCCICGGYAGKHKQWWNRDDEYGICPACANEQTQKLTPEEMTDLYGHAGVHYSL